MKNKLFKVFVSIFLAFSFVFSVWPVAATSQVTAKKTVENILNYQLKKSGNTTVQQWLNETAAKNAGSYEWYVLALAQYQSYNFSTYQKALQQYLNSETVGSASSRLKYALVLSATGSTDPYIYKVLQNDIGKQGIMSWIFGLHLLNNGYTGCYTAEQVKSTLLSMQLADGGWCVMGQTAEVDATAMVVQALAPYYKRDTAVQKAVDKALNLLSVKQNVAGNFASYGVNNPESTAQVLLALASLGIDALADSRFIKNGNNLLNGLAVFALLDGSYCHEEGGKSNSLATVQVFYATVAYLRQQSGRSAFYLLDAANPSGLQKTITSGSSVTDSRNQSVSVTENSSSKASSNAKKQNTSAATLTSGAAESSTALQSGSLGSTVSETFGAEPSQIDVGSVAENTAEVSKKSGSYKPWVIAGIVLVAILACVLRYIATKKNTEELPEKTKNH